MSAVEPIAIVGIACRLPGGVRNPDDLWKLLVTGTDAVAEVPEERWHIPATYHPDPRRPGRMNTRWGGFLDHIDRFDAQFFGISPREAELADPQQRLLLEVAYHAAEDAGLTLAQLANKRASVFIGICSWDYSFLQLNSESRSAIDAYTNVGSSLCIVANRISYFFNLKGPSLVVDTACSSSLVATHLGCRSIWTGESELAFVGGVNLTLRPELTIGFSKASMLSPDGRCKSFDARANGYVRGEGAGVIILKPLARALAEGDHIYALIRATAVNQDGRTAGISLPNQTAQEANIVDALRLAHIAPDSVQYVEAHGTGTAVGDPIEAAALGAAYGKCRRSEDRCVVGSIKSNIGHLEAAAGITGLIKTALCLQRREIPKTLHFETPNPQIAFDELRLRVADQLQRWPDTHGQPPRAGVNSFGFGGTNGHAILEAAPEALVTTRRRSEHADAGDDDQSAWMLPLSARSQSALADLARSYFDALGEGRGLQGAALRDVCFSASVKRSHHDYRLALVAHDKAELAEQLAAFLRGEERVNSSSGRIGAVPQPVFVCSGMGQQWWAMGRQLLAQEPVFRRAVDEVSELFGKFAGWSLLDELTADERASRVQETRVGQPAIFALQVGLAALWRSWGVEPAAVLGHSAGEMAATYIAGVLSLEDAVTVTFHRSRLQHRTAGQGTMLAVGISCDEAMKWVARHPRAISIAAINGANSVTLSGDQAVLAEIDKTLGEADVFSRPLRVDVPYHSPKMEPLEADLLEGLRNIRPQVASIPFFSTVTGSALAGLEVDANYWYRNVRQPVLFYDTITELAEAGHRTFLELGAHPILRHDIAQCLGEKAAGGAMLWSLRRDERERAALLGSLGRLYTLGADIDWQKLYPTHSSVVKLPSYPFQAEVHWRESDITRRVRQGKSVHPLLGNRLEVAKPSWSAVLDTAGLTYLIDHRIGDSIIFPGAGYVEMALAAARETFGSGPCVVENIEFQKFLVLDELAAPLAQVVFDPSSSEFEIYSRSNATDGGWDLHAQGCVRSSNGASAARVDTAAIRRRCTEEFTQAECHQRFAECGYHYGPTFQGVARLWRGEREVIAEIDAPSGVREQLSEYRLHPAVLDACFQTLLPTLPSWQGMKSDTFVPVKIERLRFHVAPPARAVAHTRVTQLGASELKVDIGILDETGLPCVEVQGLVVRAIASGAQRVRGALYEYQWKLSLPSVRASGRNANHLPPLAALAAAVEQENEILSRRFDRARYQGEFQSRSRAAAAAYIVRALRELGWAPALHGTQSAPKLAERLGLAPHYHRWLSFMLKELTVDEFASTAQPLQLWKAAWDEFPECQAELLLMRRCGENLSAVLRGEADPLDLIFPEGTLTSAEALYQDSPSFRVNNLLVQKAMAEIARCLPNGKALRVLEIGGGTGGMTSFVLPVLPEHCAEYVFTDVSSRFTSHAQHRFARFPFVHCRSLDIERDPVEQGFDLHAFDVIIVSDVLHATRDLRKTLGRINQLLGSGGALIIAELTHPWLFMTSIFGLLKGWWLFDDDVRRDEPCVSQQIWKNVLRDAGFSDTVCIADCPAADIAQHSVILARGAERPAAPAVAPQGSEESKTWLVFADAGAAGRPSAGAELARRLAARGDRLIEVRHGVSFQHDAAGGFSIRAGSFDDMRRLVAGVGQQVPRLDGIVHLWSLDSEPTESLSNDALVSSTRLGSISVMQVIQALAAASRLAVDGIWLVTHAAQPLDHRREPLQLAQSPLWGFGRVAINEYQNYHFQLVDLATRSGEEIAALIAELSDPTNAEDEIALHGELRYVRRLLPVTPGDVHGMGRMLEASEKCFRLEVARPGILDSLHACSTARTLPGPNEVEVEVAAVGLNFMDVMLAMGMLPPDAAADGSAGKLLGLECSGRVTAVGEQVSEFAVGDEVIAAKACSLISHLTVDRRFVARKPTHLTLEQAATIPLAFLTAFYSLHVLGRMQRGERVLIHSGSGGVGLAAVQIALQAGAIVFATAGSHEKRELLSVLGVPHVMDSRTLAFSDEVLQATNGEGVDLVLNSLSGEAIDKSLALLRPHGRFIEIGKTDIYRNRKIGMRALRRNISVFVADLLGAMGSRPEVAQGMLGEVLGWVERRDLRPLPLRAFPAGRAAEAFRTMAQAKHIGKLVISMADSAGLEIAGARPPVTIVGEASYLVTGGLGGLGLAVADRLARRGARHLALIGRRAPSGAAQAFVEGLRQRGVEVMVAAADVTDRAQMGDVIAAAQRMGPLKGIMHAAMALDDAPIERLTEERMWKAMAPKIVGAWNLHNLTVDASLDFFVLFSSLASVIGNAGQANYVAGNAFLDALAYYRRSHGLPALTINWGVVGEVGHVAGSRETAQRLERLGLKAMSIADTLDALDELMASEAVQIGVAEVEWKSLLSSMAARTPARYSGLVADSGGEKVGASTGSGVHDILEADAAALPSLLEAYIRDLLARAMGTSPARIDIQQSLRNLGLDSLIAVEVRNRINTDLGMNVPLAKFMQGDSSISALAAYAAERLTESERTGDDKKPGVSVGNGGSPTAESSPLLSGAAAADLLERIDELSEEEIDSALSELAPEGRS